MLLINLWAGRIFARGNLNVFKSHAIFGSAAEETAYYFISEKAKKVILLVTAENFIGVALSGEF